MGPVFGAKHSPSPPQNSQLPLFYAIQVSRMSSSNHVRRAPRPRTTVALSGTSKSTPAHLSFDAELAIAYAQCWLHRAGSLKVPAAGVIRAALVAYARRLHELAPMSAFRDAESACKALVPDLEARQAAELRLYTVPPTEPLPPFEAILRSPVARQQLAATMDRAEALAETVLASRRLRRGTAPAM